MLTGFTTDKILIGAVAAAIVVLLDNLISGAFNTVGISRAA